MTEKKRGGLRSPAGGRPRKEPTVVLSFRVPEKQKNLIKQHIDNLLKNTVYNFMKAILEIPEKEISFEFDNLTYNQFRMIGSKPNDKIPMILEKFPIGEPITLMTSNMPEVLKEEIIKLISQYCGH